MTATDDRPSGSGPRVLIVEGSTGVREALQDRLGGAAMPAATSSLEGALIALGEYRWDQQNRLVRYLQGTHESVYEYDGESKRVRIRQLTSGVETKNETFVWCRSRICQKRSGSTVLRNFFQQGFEEGTNDYFYTRDHLGSVREVGAVDGTTSASQLRYTAWGEVSESGSVGLSDFAFTGHYFHRPSGLALTWYRPYDANLGRWLSKDPIGLHGGTNLYRYVGNRIVSATDPLGLMDEVGPDPGFGALAEIGRAFGEFLKRYRDMREANWKNSDKYFHCMANCSAASSGDEFGAHVVSEGREITDEYLKGDSPAACNADREANKTGLDGKGQNCRDVCGGFRPAGLPEQY